MFRTATSKSFPQGESNAQWSHKPRQDDSRKPSRGRGPPARGSHTRPSSRHARPPPGLPRVGEKDALNKPTLNTVVYGIQPVLAALHAQKRRLKRLLYSAKLEDRDVQMQQIQSMWEKYVANSTGTDEEKAAMTAHMSFSQMDCLFQSDSITHQVGSPTTLSTHPRVSFWKPIPFPRNPCHFYRLLLTQAAAKTSSWPWIKCKIPATWVPFCAMPSSLGSMVSSYRMV